MEASVEGWPCSRVRWTDLTRAPRGTSVCHSPSLSEHRNRRRLFHLMPSGRATKTRLSAGSCCLPPRWPPAGPARSGSDPVGPPAASLSASPLSPRLSLQATREGKGKGWETPYCVARPDTLHVPGKQDSTKESAPRRTTATGVEAHIPDDGKGSTHTPTTPRPGPVRLVTACTSSIRLGCLVPTANASAPP